VRTVVALDNLSVKLFYTEVSALNDKQQNVKTEINAGALEALARCLLPAIRSYFESDEGQREFAEWQALNGKSTGGDEVKSDT
jgi:hypothetical protein